MHFQHCITSLGRQVSASEWIILSGRCYGDLAIYFVTRQACTTSTSNVLFDANVPTLTALDGDM